MSKKYKLIAIIIPIIFLFFITLFNWYHFKNFVLRMNSPKIEFENAYFKINVMETLDFPYKKKIREYDTRKIEALYIEGGDLIDLKYFPNLKTLTVTEVDNEGLKDIGKCKSLEILTIGGDFSDITPLSDLNNLKFINIKKNRVKDFLPLSKLAQLEQLAINIYKAKDINFLSYLTELEILLLGDMHELKDISPLANLKNLVRLDLEALIELKDIQPISELTELKNLRILGCPKVTDISPIKNLNNLIMVELASTGVKDISIFGDLSKFPKLVNVLLDEDEIENKQQLNVIKEEIKRRYSEDIEYEWIWKYDWNRWYK